MTEEKQDGRAVGYTYDPAGNRTRITWPDGKHADYSYTARHELASVSFEGVALAAYSYDIQGRATGASFGNGNSASVAHEADDDLQILAYALKDEAGAAQALEWTYTYTDAHRLLSQSVTVPAHDWSPPANVTTTYAAPSMSPATEAANKVDQYEAVAEAVNGGAPQSSGLSYDVRGNLIADGTWVYTYDLENRMISASSAASACNPSCSYTYDPSGRRIAKSVNGTVTRFLHAGSAEIAEYDSGGGLLRRYVPGAGPDTFVVWIEGTGTTSASMKWILADRQGSVAVVTDNAGKAVQRFAYDPFGNETQGAPGTGFPFRYTGQRLDPETGLYYYKARYYSAKLGRFLQTDPIGYTDHMNLYSYVGNDPTNKTDPDGKVAQWLIGLGAGVVVEVVFQLITGELTEAIEQAAEGNWDPLLKSLAKIGVSGASGALTGGISSLTKALGSGGLRRLVNWLSATFFGAASGGARSGIDGKNVLEGMIAGAVGGGAGKAAGGLLGRIGVGGSQTNQTIGAVVGQIASSTASKAVSKGVSEGIKAAIDLFKPKEQSCPQKEDGQAVQC